MAYKPEKICTRHIGKTRKTARSKAWMKAMTSRYNRRLARRLGEDAPRKNAYFGWSD